MDEQVAVADGGEHVDRLVLVERLEALRRDGLPGLALQAGQVQLGDGIEGRQVQHAGDFVDVGRLDAQAALQQRPCGGRHRALHLQADGRPEAPLAELLLDGHQEVVGLVLLDGQVGVARDAEEVVFQHLHAREEGIQVGRDDLLEQDVRALAHLDQARQHGRHLDAGEAALTGLGVTHRDRQRQRKVADVGEGVAGVHRQGRQDGEDLVQEAAPQLEAPFLALGVRDDADVVGEELGVDAGEGRRMRRHERQDLVADGVQGLGGGQPVGGRIGTAGRQLLLQAGHADLEELVEVVGEDGQEARSLQQRVAGVGGLEQDARVELQPRQLAVDVGQRRGHPVPGRATSGGRADGRHAGELEGAARVRRPAGSPGGRMPGRTRRA